MPYSWDREKFVEQIKILMKMVDEETDIIKKNTLQRYLDCANKVYHETFNKFPKIGYTTKQKFVSIVDSRLEYGRYYSIISRFLEDANSLEERVFGIATLMDEYEKDSSNPKLESDSHISRCKAISLVNFFYKDFDDELYALFSEAFKDRFDFVKFSDSKIKEETFEASGSTLFIGGVNKSFVTLYEGNDVSLYEAIVHEYGHVIQNLINPEVNFTYREDFFAEVASIFPELVAMYENSPGFNTVQTQYSRYMTFLSYWDNAFDLDAHMPIANIWNDANYKFNSKFYKNLKQMLNLTKRDFKRIVDVTLELHGVYVLSYITSLELLYIYKQDKKKALELFKGLLRVPANVNIIEYIETNIGLNIHAKDELVSLMDDMEAALTKRR